MVTLRILELFAREVCNFVKIRLIFNIFYCAWECAKFRRSRAVVGLVGLGQSCQRGYFVGPKFFLVGISWVQNFFSGISWVWNFSLEYFMGPKFSCGCFVGSKFSRGYSWVRIFFWWVFRGSEFFSREYFVAPFFFLWLISWFKDFKLLAAWGRATKNTSQTTYSFLNWFQQL